MVSKNNLQKQIDRQGYVIDYLLQHIGRHVDWDDDYNIILKKNTTKEHWRYTFNKQKW